MTPLCKPLIAIFCVIDSSNIQDFSLTFAVLLHDMMFQMHKFMAKSLNIKTVLLIWNEKVISALSALEFKLHALIDVLVLEILECFRADP